MFTYNFRTMKSYKCFYCMHKYIKFEDIATHHAENHSSEKLKIWRKTENENSYRIRNYHSYIPDTIVESNQTVHINDENITICSKSESTPNKAIKKKLSDYSPGVISRKEDNQHNENVPVKPSAKRSLFEGTDSELKSFGSDDIKVDNDCIDKEVLEILPVVLEILKAAGKYEAFKKFMTLVANATFPLDNIAFLLFLDIVTWFSKSNSSKMNIYILRQFSFGGMDRNYFMEDF